MFSYATPVTAIAPGSDVTALSTNISGTVCAIVNSGVRAGHERRCAFVPSFSITPKI